MSAVPWPARLAEVSDVLELRILRRDENPALLATHTTGGSSSIPVVMGLDRTFDELGWWGPRPDELQAWVLKEGLALTKQERYKRVRTWYARDRGRTTLPKRWRTRPGPIFAVSWAGESFPPEQGAVE